MADPMNKKPRRRIIMIAKIEADSWDALQGHLRTLETDIAMHGRLPPNSVSGGYSSGHIVVTSEDEDITHDLWAAELDAYLEDLHPLKGGAE